MDSYVVVDIETTGLHPGKDRILEIGAIKVVDREVVDTFSTFVDAQTAIAPNITRLTGITNEMIAGAPKPGEAVADFAQFSVDFCLLGHNIQFDYSFLKRCAANHNLNLERMGMDTLKLARKLLPDIEKRNLEYLCNYYGIIQEEKHRAYYDALSTHQLYVKMKEAYYEGQSEVFEPYPLIYKVKKQSPITKFQKAYLNDLLKYHRIELEAEIDSLTKNEASRQIDLIISRHGRIQRG